VRAVPAIVRTATRQLARQAARGRPITRPLAARVLARQTRRVLSNPRACALAVARNVRGTRAIRRAPARRFSTTARSVRRRF